MLKRIAIYHNLKSGGALEVVSKINKELEKLNIKITVFSPNRDRIHKNFLFELFDILFKLRTEEGEIAKKIYEQKFDCVFIFPSLNIQSPYLISFLKQKGQKHIYFFQEPKREFYEPTSFDHFSFKRTLVRFFRYFIKFIDLYNCKKADTIITNSYYSSYLLKKIYKKNSLVIKPGIEYTPMKKSFNSQSGQISIGLLSMIKGYDFSIKTISNTHQKKEILTIIGRSSDETNLILKMAKDLNVMLEILDIKNERKKNKILKSKKIYLSNQYNEPFGIATLEGCNSGLFILGKNTGGTSEIVEHGINGFLYPSEISLSSKIYNYYINQKKINFNKTCKINWNEYVRKILIATSDVLNQ